MTTQDVRGDSLHALVSRRKLEARLDRAETSGLVGAGGDCIVERQSHAKRGKCELKNEHPAEFEDEE